MFSIKCNTYSKVLKQRIEGSQLQSMITCPMEGFRYQRFKHSSEVLEKGFRDQRFRLFRGSVEGFRSEIQTLPRSLAERFRDQRFRHCPEVLQNGLEIRESEIAQWSCRMVQSDRRAILQAL